MKGRFVTFEGMDNAGKSTQIAKLQSWLTRQNIRALTTREPGGAAVSERLRELVLTGKDKMSAKSEALIMFAAREEHLRQVIAPALADGKWVVCDRFADSTFAYQGGGGEVDDDWLRAVARGVGDGCAPDITFYLASPAQGAPRRDTLLGDKKAHDHFEDKGIEFFKRVQQAYEKIAATESSRVVKLDIYNGRQRVGRDALARQIQSHIKRRLMAQ